MATMYGITADELHKTIVIEVAGYLRHLGREDLAERIESDGHPLRQNINSVLAKIMAELRSAESKKMPRASV